jgi:hypothetical protein
MNLRPFQVVFPAGLAAVLLFLISCASDPDEGKNVSSAYSEGVPGGTWVESYEAPVTIAAIDSASRKVTLVETNNNRDTFTATPDFKGFDQLRVGEQVQAAMARELVVFLRQNGPPPAADTSVAKELIKDRDQSDILKTETVEKTAKVKALHPNQGEATLQFADGTTQNISVRTDVNLWSFKVGEEVIIRRRSAAVLNLKKP